MPRLTLVTMLNCGQGMTTLVEVYDNGNEDGPADYLALIDCGGDLAWGGRESVDYIARKVEQSGSLPNIVISHQDMDHNSLLRDLGGLLRPMQPHIDSIFLGGTDWQSVNVKRVQKFARTVGYQRDPEFANPMRSDYMKAGGGLDSLAEYNDVHLRVLMSHLNVGGKAMDIRRNASSAVIVVENGHFAVVLPGDATWQTMRQISQIPNLKATLPTVVGLSIPHHGSLRTAVEDYHAGRLPKKWEIVQEFSDTIAPWRIGASAGPFNRHHHPVSEVLDKFTTVRSAPCHDLVAYVFNCHGPTTQCWQTLPSSTATYCTVQSIGALPERSKKRWHWIKPFCSGDIIFRLSEPGVLRPEEMVEFRPRGTAGTERATDGIVRAPAP
ncbi:hypothetical protein ACWELB_23970 [Streptomyces asiaticus]|uniref:hypothetical protein n=1 Tax=Streptomyces asiaticus TaxID=114695 RepID=UPI003D717D99